MKIEGPITLAKLMETVIAEGKKKKLSVPFLADGFKSEKTPTQPDGVTPIVVEKANIVNRQEIEQPKITESKKTKEETKKITTTEPIKKAKRRAK
jgi:hypothetical protein